MKKWFDYVSLVIKGVLIIIFLWATMRDAVILDNFLIKCIGLLQPVDNLSQFSISIVIMLVWWVAMDKIVGIIMPKGKDKI